MPLLPIKLPVQSPKFLQWNLRDTAFLRDAQSPPLPIAMVNTVVERIREQPPKRPPTFDLYTIEPPQ